MQVLKVRIGALVLQLPVFYYFFDSFVILVTLCSRVYTACINFRWLQNFILTTSGVLEPNKAENAFFTPDWMCSFGDIQPCISPSRINADIEC